MSKDDSLLEGLKSGDATAYEWLVSQFEGPLFRFFVCDHRDYHLAQEQTSETFVQLVRSLRSMTGDQSQLRAFVFSIARRVKSRQQNGSRLRQSLSAIDAEITDPHPSPAAQADNREQVERMLLAISRFEPGVRDVLLFRFVEGYSVVEIAGLVELPVGTVKSHIHRGVARLKKILTDSGCHS